MPQAEHRVVGPVTAHSISVEALHHLASARSGKVLAVGREAIYVALDGFVLAVTGRAVQRMPNGISLIVGPHLPLGPVAGSPARLSSGSMLLGRLRVDWDAQAPRTWDPSVPVWSADVPTERLRRRGAQLLLSVLGLPQQAKWSHIASELRKSLGIAEVAAGREGIELLLRAVAERDATLARKSSEILIGLGSGLTPEGDDLLAAAAVATRAVAPAVGFSEVGHWVSSLIPQDHGSRTNRVSSCLLELAARGCTLEPVARVLDPDSTEAVWRSALDRLIDVGHSTGQAYACCLALTVFLLAGNVGSDTWG